jgi:predicted AlkP superfamily phosphohydrolase/phosphomutase
MQSKHVLIVGVDGGTFSLIRPWAEQGYLPNLKRLLDEGVSRDLLTTFPPVTSPAWPSFMTGMNPGHHGVFDFIRPKGGDYDMVNSTSIRQPTLWDWLSSARVRVGVINVPVTYPPHPVNGFMITGLLSPRNATISYPDDLIRRYEPKLGPYRIAPNVQCKRGEEALFIADLCALEEVRGRYALALLENEPWDVMAVVFGATDVASHALWRFADETHPGHDPNAPEAVKNGLRDVYAVVDAQIGRLVEAAPPDTTVIVMSDHGFGPLLYTVNLNLLLMEKGLMHLRHTPITQLKALLFRLGISPKTIYAWLERVGLHHLASRVSKKQRNKVVGKFLSYDDVDWQRTGAFSMGHVGQIYVNTKGIHPYGSVDPGEEEGIVRQEVIDALNSLRHPATGEPIVDRIILREEEFSGPYTTQGPDIQVVLDGYRCISFPLFATSPELFTEQIRGDSGCHRLEGIFIASGPGIRREAARTPAHITDVAPTVMYLLGLPIPSEMTGHPLQDILVEPHQAIYTPPNPRAMDPETGLMSAEEDEIEARLRSLGYLE